MRYVKRTHWQRTHGQGRVWRPAVVLEIRPLIRLTHAANPLWGAPRIHGERRTLGIEIAQTTWW